MKVVRRLDERLWQEFAESHPSGNIFHTPEIFQAFSRTRRHHPTLWAVTGNDERILALLLPVQVTLLNRLFRRLTSRAVVYGSVLCAPETEGQEALAVLLRTYKREVEGNVLFTELRNLSDTSALQPVLRGCGFVYEEHLNFIVDLTRPQKDIWKSIRPNARRNIRKAHKLGVAVEDIDDPRRIPAIHAVLKQIYRRIHVPLANISFFQASFEILHPQGMMKILVAKSEDVDIGVLTLLLYKDIVYYWYTGTLREYASYRAGDLLVWHALEWGSQNGFRILDFGGAGKPNEEYGVRDFKAKFGGTLVNYGRNICIHAPVRLKLSKAGYQLVRRFL